MTLNKATEKFIKDKIALEPEKVKSARTSRDWLIGKIENFPQSDSNFPKINKDRHIEFGSFARKTKIRELDDIDYMFCLSGEGSSYSETSSCIEISVPETAEKLLQLCHLGTNKLNSRKVIESFKKKLTEIPQYDSNWIRRNQEAATLYLRTYGLNFDIVPCFYTVTDFYLIPDGNGHWKKTDPRKDRDRVININQFKNGKVLEIIRLVKYWNKRPTMPSMGSYLLETMILDYYTSKWDNVGNIWEEFKNVLKYIELDIYSPVYDAKGIQGDINNQNPDEKRKISERAAQDIEKIDEILKLNSQGLSSNLKTMTRLAKEILGDSFSVITEVR